MAPPLDRGYTPPTSITKEIAKDIYLIKELIQPPGMAGAGLQGQAQGADRPFYFVFRLTNNALKDVDFHADFSGSENLTVSRDEALAS